jgi:hypothetical protein
VISETDLIIVLSAAIGTGLLLWLALFLESHTYKRDMSPKGGKSWLPILVLVAIVALCIYGLYQALLFRGALEDKYINVFLTFSVVLLIGFLIIVFLYHRFHIRAPGVIATPLLSVYALENYYVIPLTAFVTLVLYGIIWMIQSQYFIYGRRLFLIGCAFSVLLSCPLLIWFNLNDIIIVTILPAIFAYNIIVTVERRAISIGVLLGVVGLLYGTGILLVKIF